MCEVKKIWGFIAVFLGFYSIGMAQQEAQFSQYMQNYFLVNPAEGGTEEFIDLRLGSRTQWTGLEGAPRTIFVSGHAPIGKKTSRFDDVKQMPFHGVGGYVMKDETGPSSRTSLYASYAYHLPVSANNDLVLSFGMNAGLKQYQLDENEISFYSEEYEGVEDQAIIGVQNKLMPDVTAGIWAYSKNYFMGISAFQLLRNKVSFYTTENGGSSTVTDNLDMHFFFTGGYKFHLKDSTWMLIPSFVVKQVSPAPVAMDFNCKLRYKSLAWIGGSYRHNDSFIGMIGITAKKILEVSYSFDFTTSNLAGFNNGTHEVIVGLNLPYHEHNPKPSQFW